MAFGDLKTGSLTFTGNAASITNPFSATGSIAVNVGDLIFAVLGQQTALTVTACGDNLHGGSTYTATNAGTDSGGSSGRAFYKRVTVAGTLTSVDFVTTASANNVTAVAAAFEGPFDSSPLDANPANNTDATSSFTCPATGTLSQASELVVCWGAAPDSTVWAATSPNLLGPQVSSAALVHCLIGYQTVNATTTISPAFTAGANPTDATLGTSSFKQDLNIQIFQNTQVLSKLITYKRKSLPRHKNENNLGGFDPSETARVRSLFFLGRSFNVPRTQNRNFNVNGQTVFDQDLTPALFDDSTTDTFFSPVVNQEYPAVGFTPPVRKAPLRHRLPQSVSTPYSTINFDLSPNLYDDSVTDTFYTPIVNQEYPSVGFTPPVRDPPLRSRVPRRVSVSTPFSTIDFDLSPSLYTDDDIFYVPIVNQEYPGIGFTPPVIKPRRRFRLDQSRSTPFSTIDFDLSPSLYINTNTFYVPIISQDAEIVTRDPTPLRRFRHRVERIDPSVSLPFDSLRQDLVSSLYVDSDTFYTPIVDLQEIPSQNVIDRRTHRRTPRVYNASVSTPFSTIDFDLTPNVYVDVDTFYTPVVSLQEIPAPNVIDIRVSSRRRVVRPRNNNVVGDYLSIDLLPTLYVDDDIFYTPIVSAIYDLLPSLYTDDDIFYTPIVSLQEIPTTVLDIYSLNRHRIKIPHRAVSFAPTFPPQDLFPSLYVDDDTFYDPTVSSQGQLFPDLFDNANIFYTPTVTTSDVSARQPYFTQRYRIRRLRSKINVNISQSDFGTADLVPSLFINNNAFYNPTITQFSFSNYSVTLAVGRTHPRRRSFSVSTPVSTLLEDLAPSLYIDDDIFYTPTVTGGAINLQSTLYVDPDTFYTPSVVGGTVDLTPSLYTNTNTFYTHIVTSVNSLVPTLYVDVDTFYSPIVTATYNITPSLYTNNNVHYESFISGGDKPLFPSLYENTNIFYSPTVVGPGQDVTPSIFSGGIGRPPKLLEIRNVVVEGIVLTFTIRIIPGRPRTVSFFPGRVEIDVVAALKPLRDIEVSFPILGGAIGNDIFEDNVDDLLLIISEMLLE